MIKEWQRELNQLSKWWWDPFSVEKKNQQQSNSNHSKGCNCTSDLHYIKKET